MLLAILLILSATFSSGSDGWVFYSDADAGVVYEDAAKISVTREGVNVQFLHTGIALEGGRSYRLKFRARLNRAGLMGVRLHEDITPYTNLGLNATASLDRIMQEYTYEFTAVQGTNNGRLAFWFGPWDEAGDVYEIDDISLELVPEARQNPGRTRPAPCLPYEIPEDCVPWRRSSKLLWSPYSGDPRTLLHLYYRVDGGAWIRAARGGATRCILDRECTVRSRVAVTTIDPWDYQIEAECGQRVEFMMRAEFRNRMSGMSNIVCGLWPGVM